MVIFAKSDAMHPYVRAADAFFRPHANAANAPDMERYMRSQFKFLGIKSPQRRELGRQFAKANGYPAASGLGAVVRGLWQLPEREFQYLATDMMARFAKKCEPDFIELLEWAITEKSWWDTVDALAGHSAGLFFRRHPDLAGPVTERWANSGNMWLLRSAILFQLKYKSQTDTELLFKYIGQNAATKEFFIAKAMGWALREHSKTDAGAVVGFVNGNELPPLTRREALKWLQSKKRI